MRQAVTGRPLTLLAANELRGLAVAGLWSQIHPSLPVAIATALTGLALVWALVWRDVVKPELIARQREQLLREARA